ncbi:MAG: hypothetical protein FJ108_15865 [Deltaproteobacteria bacterium]|nr:hypothetical protein [Deltaproteobacteria bacterium]
MTRGRLLKWIPAQGGWPGAKMLVDLYGHFMSEESGGCVNALAVPDTATRRKQQLPPPARPTGKASTAALFAGGAARDRDQATSFL